MPGGAVSEPGGDATALSLLLLLLLLPLATPVPPCPAPPPPGRGAPSSSSERDESAGLLGQVEGFGNAFQKWEGRGAARREAASAGESQATLA